MRESREKITYFKTNCKLNKFKEKTSYKCLINWMNDETVKFGKIIAVKEATLKFTKEACKKGDRTWAHG